MCNVTMTNNSMPRTKGCLKKETTRYEKSVNWQGSCRVRPFLMVEEEHRSVVWYCSNDYREFKKERKAAATLAKNMGIEAIEETNFVSCRGIEYMVDEERLQNKFDMQHSAAAAVLKAQFKIFKKADLLQVEPDLASNHAIANEYERFSRQAHFEASQRALQQWQASQLAAFEEEEFEERMMENPVSPQDAMGKPVSIQFSKKKSSGSRDKKKQYSSRSGRVPEERTSRPTTVSR